MQPLARNHSGLTRVSFAPMTIRTVYTIRTRWAFSEWLISIACIRQASRRLTS